MTYLAPQSNGIIDLKELEAAMRDDTILGFHHACE
ncbi:cysteine desulfurase [Klebsiella pneumoniae]|uniref:Cysteine desulfurase n=1 Tax=Klebsiella pneumoniae TaxID=573 RepID=A0A4P0YCV0_KLEPN|nr:cysteine desulfurase [Klebsiella pneumoniae]